jgi:hypothetical protein
MTSYAYNSRAAAHFVSARLKTFWAAKRLQPPGQAGFVQPRQVGPQAALPRHGDRQGGQGQQGEGGKALALEHGNFPLRRAVGLLVFREPSPCARVYPMWARNGGAIEKGGPPERLPG